MVPSQSDTERLIAALHASGCRVVLAATGGGSGAIAALLEVPGGSRSVLEAVVPYSEAALADWLGAPPEHFCDPRTARAMAMAAWQRARKLAGAGGDVADLERLLGLGCTSSLASDRRKRGPHRIHVATQALAATVCDSLELTKGRRSRREEEDVATRLVLNALAEAVGIEPRLDPALLEGEAVHVQRTLAPPTWRELLLGSVKLVRHGPAPPPGVARGIFPGAFHPRHRGHRGMAAVARQPYGLHVEHELSIDNVDKPLLDYTEMETRAAQFAADETLWFTRAATFVEKSRLFPRCTFVVGADTALRLADPRYYGGDPSACQAALDEIARHGCRLLVFGRATPAGFQTLHDLPLPPSLRAICTGVPAEAFRDDVSSTQLRAQCSEGGTP